MTITEKEIQHGITSYTVSNGTVSFTAMNYGCSLLQILVPNKLGSYTDILQGYDTLEGWKADDASHNCVVGRFANRIALARFTLDGKTYTLDANDGKNSLHGGFTRWEKMLWNAESFEEGDSAGVRFTRTSPDGEQGYPGTLSLTVTYALNSKNELTLTYNATTDKATPINLTNHAYFNLNGGGSVLDHVVQLDCDSILEVDPALIPTGERIPVDGDDFGWVFDFHKPKAVGSAIGGSPETIDGYDHCFVTRAADESNVVRVGAVWSDVSGIKMEIATNQPGMQIYSGNFLNGTTGKGGAHYDKHSGICFETQRFPDAPNKPDFPSCILRPGETYNAVTVFTFSTQA